MFLPYPVLIHNAYSWFLSHYQRSEVNLAFSEPIWLPPILIAQHSLGRLTQCILQGIPLHLHISQTPPLPPSSSYHWLSTMSTLLPINPDTFYRLTTSPEVSSPNHQLSPLEADRRGHSGKLVWSCIRAIQQGRRGLGHPW